LLSYIQPAIPATLLGPCACHTKNQTPKWSRAKVACHGTAEFVFSVPLKKCVTTNSAKIPLHVVIKELNVPLRKEDMLKMALPWPQ